MANMTKTAVRTNCPMDGMSVIISSLPQTKGLATCIVCGWAGEVYVKVETKPAVRIVLPAYDWTGDLIQA